MILVQILGSLAILGAFVLAQAGKLKTTSVSYLVVNAVGSAALAVDAALGAQWGFLLLEGVWCIVSVASLVRIALRKPVPETH